VRGAALGREPAGVGGERRGHGGNEYDESTSFACMKII
jgi:hypothetical protein